MDFKLDTERLSIVPQNTEHSYLLWEYHKLNYKAFREFIPYNTDGSPEFEDIEAIIKLETSLMKANQALKFLVFEKDDNQRTKIIADIFVYKIIFGNSYSAHLAFSIDKRYEGRGMMSESIKEVCGFMFESVGLHRLEMNIDKINLRSNNLARRLGFQYEGTSRELLKINCIWKDMERYSLLSNDQILK
jgi:ribosomal-protein-alanine N-acetyltransferase